MPSQSAQYELFDLIMLVVSPALFSNIVVVTTLLICCCKKKKQPPQPADEKVKKEDHTIMLAVSKGRARKPANEAKKISTVKKETEISDTKTDQHDEETGSTEGVIEDQTQASAMTKTKNKFIVKQSPVKSIKTKKEKFDKAPKEKTRKEKMERTKNEQTFTQNKTTKEAMSRATTEKSDTATSTKQLKRKKHSDSDSLDTQKMGEKAVPTGGPEQGASQRSGADEV
jgi:hypothetical protein